MLLAATGDVYKSYVKAKQGPDALVTSGVYRLFRHPNYTGEQILWTANMLTAFAAVATGGGRAILGGGGGAVGLLAASVVGWAGIFFILAKATASLEKKQAERLYDIKRSASELAKWRKSSWSGFGLKEKVEESE